ncbi:amidase [Enterococcus columbae]|uniref:Amidase domain-containing protein n=1 Tax=Enterococcus columbae DSM 7374 = ATCC 51263 TaxID=1121865 RepID=S0KS01_9ENTE|nr:amidase [Enterococcus columbae]EOT42883.1 hypothetical protein OMW_00861 [Enterococcus columbae DSM 7374 = ATCC 51263]EOW87680.1 hypothetical protein I568_00345 [Enterococcus columbae DSM 7374 = ATCC 51263]OJG24661.1 hypothetical protein RR47_GL002255 [Enterococcus columbae DSM 7374 = ATCC 51263]
MRIKDALYISEQLQKKQFSFEEYLNEITQKYQDWQPKLNAFISFNPDEALAYYQKMNQVQAIRSPFQYLPIPLKGLGQNKKGWLNTAGSRLLANSRAQSNNHFVNKIEQLGMIPLGQTNIPEYGFKNITDSALHGICKNPWHLDYYSGGSSGGAASAVAAGIFPMATASDGGGSIRIPASFCGLIGLKPTRGTMPVGPNGWRGWQGASISFALTVSMRDTESLFYQMRTSQGAAPYQAPACEWRHQQALPPKKLKIAYCLESPVAKNVSATAKDAVLAAVKFLVDQGHEVVEIKYPVNLPELMVQYYRMNGADTAAMFSQMETAFNRHFTLDDMEPMTWAIYQLGQSMSASQYVQSLEYWDEAADSMEQLFLTYDLFLTPTTADCAPHLQTAFLSTEVYEQLFHAHTLSFAQREALVYDMFAKSLALTPYTQLANLTGQPALSLPTGLSLQGLPQGIQFMAAKGREDLLFMIGRQFEQNQRFILPKAYQA